VLAAMNDVARQSTKAKWQPPAEIEQNSHKRAHGTKNQKGPPEFAEWVHEVSLKLASFEVKATE
jgi:hypothetical protein